MNKEFERLARQPVCNAKECCRMFELYTGSIEEKELLYEKYKKLSYSIANKIYFGGFIDTIVEVDDLVQECNVAMVLCFEKFNPDAGMNFTTYFYRAASSRAYRYAFNLVYANVSNDIINARYRYLKWLEDNDPTNMTDLQLAEELGKSEFAVKNAKIIKTPLSLNAQLTTQSDEELTMLDLIAAEPVESLRRMSLEKELEDLLQKSNLGTKRLETLFHVYGLYGRKRLSMAELGRREGKSHQAIQQRVQHCLRKLRRKDKELNSTANRIKELLYEK